MPIHGPSEIADDKIFKTICPEYFSGYPSWFSYLVYYGIQVR